MSISFQVGVCNWPCPFKSINKFKKSLLSAEKLIYYTKVTNAEALRTAVGQEKIKRRMDCCRRRKNKNLEKNKKKTGIWREKKNGCSLQALNRQSLNCPLPSLPPDSLNMNHKYKPKSKQTKDINIKAIGKTVPVQKKARCSLTSMVDWGIEDKK